MEIETELVKEKIKIPFNAYDIFGYLLPGIITLLAIYSFEFWTKLQIDKLTNPINLHLPLLRAINISGEMVFETNKWPLSAMFFIAILIIAYIVGHIVSSVSSFFIDRIFVFKGYGYPYQLLLNLNLPDEKSYTPSFYRGFFFWANAYFLLRFYITLYPKQWLWETTFWLGWYIVAVVILKVGLSHFKKYPIIEQQKLKSLIESYAPPLLKNFDKVALFIVRYLFAGPYDLLARFLSQFINTRETFNSEFIESYKELFRSNFSLDAKIAWSNNYWFCACYIAEKSPVLNAMLINWLHMYSFARHISTAFYIAFFYCFISLFLQEQLFNFLNYRSVLFLLPLIFFFLSLIMLTRFYYLYFSYYSKFVFRAFYLLNKIKPK